MSSAICTLFEGDYHLGAAALINSLAAHGFEGTIYAGYRGPLPPWAAADSSGKFQVTEKITLQFIPLETRIHLTNYKPDFMLDLWQNHCLEAKSLFYFDPDIVIKCRWSFFEEWVEHGVGVCRDINGDMPHTHPLRGTWKKLLTPFGFDFPQKLDVYFNAGFIGLSLAGQNFLRVWKEVQEVMVKLGMTQDALGGGDRTQPFTCRDQDAMNITCMCYPGPLSAMGAQGMDFQWGGGGYVMSHAAGGIKPWRKHFLKTLFIEFIRPSFADRAFFACLDGPIRPFGASTLMWKRLDFLLTCVMSRYLGR